MIKQKIKDKMDELERVRQQHPELERDINTCSEDEIKLYFKTRTELANLLFEHNLQIIKTHTINITIPDDHTVVRKLIRSQERIFDANCSGIQNIGGAFHHKINKIELENVSFSEKLNSKEMNDFGKIFYENSELKKMIENIEAADQPKRKEL